MRSIYLLLALVNSLQMVGSQWYESEYCSGAPPDIILEFRVDNPYATIGEKEPEETWPALYSLGAPIYPFSYCGNSNVPLEPHACCLSALRPQFTENYKSGVFLKGRSYPKISNGYSYCTLEALNGTIAGYTMVKVLGDSKCKDRMYECNQNGTMRIFSENSDCSGEASLITLDRIRAFSYGTSNVSASFELMTNGSVTIGWTNHIEAIYLVPSYTSLTDWIGAFGILTGFICSFYPFYISVLNYHRTRTRFGLAYCVSHLLSIVWVVFRFIYIHLVFTKMSEMILFASIDLALYNVTTLSFALYSSNYFTENLDLQLTKKILVYGTVLCVHFGLVGGLYFIGAQNLSSAPGPFEITIQRWLRAAFLWIPFLFVFNLSPIIYTILVFSRKWGNKAQILHDRILVRCMIWHVLNCMVYFAIVLLQRWTLVFQNDKVFLTGTTYSTACIAVHGSLNVLIIQRLRALFRRRCQQSDVKLLKGHATVVAQN